MQQSDEKMRELLERLFDARVTIKGWKEEQALLQDIDVLEERIKNIGTVGKKLKQTYATFEKDIDAVWAKIDETGTRKNTLRSRRAKQWAVAIAFVFFCFYFSNSLTETLPQNTLDFIGWFVMGLIGSTIAGVYFLLLLHAHQSVIRWQSRRLGRRPPQSYLNFMFVHFTISYILICNAILRTITSWIYPFSSSFLVNALHGLVTGGVLDKALTVISLVVTIYGFLQLLFSIGKFLKKHLFT